MGQLDEDYIFGFIMLLLFLALLGICYPLVSDYMNVNSYDDKCGELVNGDIVAVEREMIIYCSGDNAESINEGEILNVNFDDIKSGFENKDINSVFDTNIDPDLYSYNVGFEDNLGYDYNICKQDNLKRGDVINYRGTEVYGYYAVYCSEEGQRMEVEIPFETYKEIESGNITNLIDSNIDVSDANAESNVHLENSSEEEHPWIKTHGKKKKKID